VGLDLLCSLHIEDISEETGKAIKIFILDFLLFTNQFLDEAKVAADSAHFGVRFHLSVHFENSVRVGSYAHVNEEGIFGVEFLAEAVEKPVMGVKFSGWFILNAEEEVHIEKFGVDFSIFVERLVQSLSLLCGFHQSISIDVLLDIILLKLIQGFGLELAVLRETGSR
jgi:hypothetical protein